MPKKTVPQSEDDASAERDAGRKALPTRKLKKEQTPPNPRDAARGENQPNNSNPEVRSQLDQGISELQRLHRLLLSSEVDPDVLADFRDALNRVRNTAWAAQQYAVRQGTDRGATSVLALLAGERVRATYQLCSTLADDLKNNKFEFQRGSLVQLFDAAKSLVKELKRVVGKE